MKYIKVYVFIFVFFRFISEIPDSWVWYIAYISKHIFVGDLRVYKTSSQLLWTQVSSFKCFILPTEIHDIIYNLYVICF